MKKIKFSKINPKLAFFLSCFFGFLSLFFGTKAVEFLWLGVDMMEEIQGIYFSEILYWIIVIIFGVLAYICAIFFQLTNQRLIEHMYKKND